MKHHDHHNVVKASEVIDVEVYNNADEKLGEIEEIILDKKTGQAYYAVLSFGGFLGLGEKLFTVPWSALDYQPSKEGFVLDVSKERLKEAPGFDKDHWPDMEDTKWGEGIFNFYHKTPYWKH
jgi:sporulation protein YlmC with PRC-barrel domain